MLSSSHLKIWLAALAIALTGHPAASQWQATVATDSMTDERVGTAEVTSSEGHRFGIRQTGDGPVEAYFRLAKSGEVMGSTPPVYRVDSLEAVDVGEMALLCSLRAKNEELRTKIAFHGEDLPLAGLLLIRRVWGCSVEMEPKWAIWKIFHGFGTPTEGPLRDLMDGNSVLVRYHLFTGGYLESRFSLGGAQKAIAEALQIAPTPPDDYVSGEELARTGIKRCGELPPGNDSDCLKSLAMCFSSWTGTDGGLEECFDFETPGDYVARQREECLAQDDPETAASCLKSLLACSKKAISNLRILKDCFEG